MARTHRMSAIALRCLSVLADGRTESHYVLFEVQSGRTSFYQRSTAVADRQTQFGTF